MVPVCLCVCDLYIGVWYVYFFRLYVCKCFPVLINNKKKTSINRKNDWFFLTRSNLWILVFFKQKKILNVVLATLSIVYYCVLCLELFKFFFSLLILNTSHTHKHTHTHRCVENLLQFFLIFCTGELTWIQLNWMKMKFFFLSKIFFIVV